MDIHVWLMFFLAYFVTTLAPGPNVFLVLKNSIKFGWKYSFITIFGNLLCQFLIVCMVALGFGVLLQSSPTWFLYAKVIGGSYLIYIGLKSLLSKKNSSFHIDNNGASVKKNTTFSIFLEAFLVSASNPKTVIFLSAFLPQFIDVNHSANEQFLIMFLTICLIVTVVHIGYSIGIHHIKKYFSEKKFNSYVSKITSSVLVLMGIAVLSSNKS